MEKILSVVIPVFNVEDFIRKCLDSLLVPDDVLPLLDIVIVNDGTEDRSAEIAKTYESRYPDVFRVFDKENGGHGSACNLGIAEAKGKYMSILDSDDWYDTSQLALLVSYLRECDTDLVFLNWTRYYAAKQKEVTVRIQKLKPDVVYSSDSFDWMNSGNGFHLGYQVCTVYRTEMMQRYLPVFCEGVMYDDIILQVLPVMASRTFIYKDLNVYHYYIGRPGQSMDPQVKAKRSGDVTTVLKQVLDFMKNNKESIPEGTTRRIWADFHYSAFATYHYDELSRYSFSVSKKRLADWDRYVRATLPDIELTGLVKLYRTAPFAVYYAFYKVYWLMKKCLRRVGALARK